MTEDNINKLIQMNERLLLIMGHATYLILDLAKDAQEENKHISWIIKAIENVVYLDKPLPKMP
jgi:hypothetical protein